MANEIAVAALAFLAEDSDRFVRFLGLSGIDPATIRQAAAEPRFLGGILDYVAADERLLLDFATASGLRPDQIVQARMVLSGPETPP